MSAALLRCCVAVLHGEEGVLRRLREAGFDCEPGYWAFRLPALHRFLGATEDYRSWRQALYAGDLNARLRELGAEIAIAENRGHADQTLYCLRRL